MAEQANEATRSQIHIYATRTSVRAACAWSAERKADIAAHFPKHRYDNGRREWILQETTLEEVRAWASQVGFVEINDVAYAELCTAVLDAIDDPAEGSAPGIAGLSWGAHPYLTLDAPDSDELRDMLQPIGGRHDGLVWEMDLSALRYLRPRVSASAVNTAATKARHQARQCQRANFDRLSQSRWMTMTATGAWFTAPYNADVVALLRTRGFAQWDSARKAYHVATNRLHEMSEVLPQIESLLAQKGITRDEPQSAQAVSSAPPLPSASSLPTVPCPKPAMQRKIMLVNKAPSPGKVTKTLKEGIVVITRHSKAWAVDERTIAVTPSLSSHIGDACCYVYYRPATTEEAITLAAPAPTVSVRTPAPVEATVSPFTRRMASYVAALEAVPRDPAPMALVQQPPAMPTPVTAPPVTSLPLQGQRRRSAMAALDEVVLGDVAPDPQEDSPLIAAPPKAGADAVTTPALPRHGRRRVSAMAAIDDIAPEPETEPLPEPAVPHEAPSAPTRAFNRFGRSLAPSP